jgi:hypothetical protein
MLNPLDLENADLSLLRDKGPFSRARGDRLYTSKGQHWVDLWKENGAYLTGRRPEGVIGVWKNEMVKGLGGVFPTVFPHRLERQLVQRWPQARKVLIFRSPERAWAACTSLLERLNLPFDTPWLDTARPGETPSPLCLDRPWVDSAESVSRSFLIWPILPWGSVRVRILLIGPAWPGELPNLESDLVSGAETAALIGALVGLRRVETNPTLWQGIKETWAKVDTLAAKGTHRQGPYWNFNTEHYPVLFEEFFQRGFLLPPSPHLSALLPLSLSDGEKKALQEALDGFHQKETSWT